MILSLLGYYVTAITLVLFKGSIVKIPCLFLTLIQWVEQDGQVNGSFSRSMSEKNQTKHVLHMYFFIFLSPKMNVSPIDFIDSQNRIYF